MMMEFWRLKWWPLMKHKIVYTYETQDRDIVEFVYEEDLGQELYDDLKFYGLHVEAEMMNIFLSQWQTYMGRDNFSGFDAEKITVNLRKHDDN